CGRNRHNVRSQKSRRVRCPLWKKKILVHDADEFRNSLGNPVPRSTRTYLQPGGKRRTNRSLPGHRIHHTRACREQHGETGNHQNNLCSDNRLRHHVRNTLRHHRKVITALSTLANRRPRRFVPVIPAILLLMILSTFSLPVHHPSVNTTQLPPTGIAWVTEPLQQVYNLIQSRFIGLIPGNYTEPSSSDYSTMSTIFGLIDTGVSQNDAGSILSASSVATQLNYQLIPVNDSATGNKYYVLMENTTVNRGWGSYLFAAERSPSTTQVIMEAPHPVTDFNSQQIAYTIFTSAYPHVTALLVSGVERTFGSNGQTDMAHRTQSIFETAHEAFTKF